MYHLRLSTKVANCSYARLKAVFLQHRLASSSEKDYPFLKNNLCTSEALQIEEEVLLETNLNSCFPHHNRDETETAEASSGEQEASEYLNEAGISFQEYRDVKGVELVTKVSLQKEKVKIEDKLSYYHIQKDLKSYLHACVNSNSVEKAHYALIWNRYKHMKYDSQSKYPVIGVKMYNILLKAWALQGKTNRVQELWRLMDMASIAPNMQSYACYFLCLANQSSDTGTSDDTFYKVMEDIRKHGSHLEDVLRRSILNIDDRSKVRKYIHSRLPHVQLKVDPPSQSYGIDLLKSLDNSSKLNERTTLNDLVSDANLKQWYQEQVKMESTGWTKVKSVYVENSISPDFAAVLRSRWNKTELEWRSIMQKTFEKNLHILRAKLMEHQGVNVYPFLTAMEPKCYVDEMFNEILQMGTFSEYFSPPYTLMHRMLGEKVMYRYLTHIRIKNRYFAESSQLYSKYRETLTKPMTNIARETCEQIATQNQMTLRHDLDEMAWSPDVCRSVGKFLYDIIQHDVKLDGNIMSQNPNAKVRPVPVMFTLYRPSKNCTKEEVRAHPVYLKLYKAVCQNELRFPTYILPMVVPPFPWLAPNIGGYLITDTTFIRDCSYNSHQVPNRQLYPVIDALNALSLQPWKINAKVLDLAIDVFRRKGNMKLDIPLHTSTFPAMPKFDKKKTSTDRLQVFKAQLKEKRMRSEMYSLWCGALYKLSIANHFRDRLFWFPHNLDFRGRVYACPPHFNHLGGDLSRAILLFGNGKPLGPKGLDWLKIHLINLTGLKKKASLNERLDYANEILPKILDCAENPMVEDQWWMQSDEPWQTLACCMQIADALKSPNPEEYICYFPVHQDGSCNGLQHYAALGRDQQGAEAVNLVPDERPQDVYSVVAALVEQERQNDAAGDLKIACALDGFVQRKVVKQTVMTFVYGVTRYGARLQILRKLKDMESFPSEIEWGASAYLMHKIFNSIQEMFTATREIQTWFGASAQEISQALSSPVKWTTPLGFPVTQPYKKTVTTKAQNSDVISTTRGVLSKPNVLKQKNAFAPNFIHSLDSTHMMLTALHCYKKNVDFVSVHDCFWTHPCSVDEMNEICRDQFVALHSLPILEDLSKFFIAEYGPQLESIQERHPDAYRRIMKTLTNVPKTGSFNLENVKESVYFFS